MHKEELIQLHTYMAQMKRYFEKHGVVDEFDEYKALSISPVHIHRSKADHKRAIFILGGELAHLMSKEDPLKGAASQAPKPQIHKTISSAFKLMGHN
ncbi:MAG: UPF0058 family protein [Methanosarcinaceae archaeon]|nr:UPF0058 family protein [Methanosarcinaceae archaeon]MDD4330936.1 UPF0058 family protein [Methanosarcinaceae archaeon]MDD4748990.1 UPF0058 family protein [Methanosarcinaceae archaeon]